MRRREISTVEQSTVNKETLVAALRQLGIQEGDLCMVHSSMKSFGHLEGGPQAVVDAFETVLGKEGTLAMPALIQKDYDKILLIGKDVTE